MQETVYMSANIFPQKCSYQSLLVQVVTATAARDAPHTPRPDATKCLVLLRTLATGINSLVCLLANMWGKEAAVQVNGANNRKKIIII